MKLGEMLDMRQSNWLVSVFIIAYICTTTLSLLPASQIRNALFDPIRPVILYTGLWQNFILFAPDPPKSNIDIRATITKQNGEKVIWQYPRMEKLNIIERIEKERYRSFGIDYANYYEILRPGLARFIARIYKDDLNPPQTITLERHWADIPPPGVDMDKALPPHDNHCTIFTYEVHQSDLR